MFKDGFRAMVPLWLGVVPFGLAYAVIAREEGLSFVETQASPSSCSRAARR